MKKNLLVVLMCMFAVTTFAKGEKETVTFHVPIECQNCVNKVESNIAYEKGVKALECNIEAETVTVTYLAEKTNVENLKKGFAKIGYDKVTVVKSCAADCKGACCKDKEAKACCDNSKTSSCKDKAAKACCGESKSDCSKDKTAKTSSADCKADCCKEKDAKTCKADCKGACCKDKAAK